MPQHSQHGLPGHHHHQGHHNPAAAYSYTDSEADSNYAVTLNGGHIIMNNMAGSRAPLPGFSSFCLENLFVTSSRSAICIVFRFWDRFQYNRNQWIRIMMHWISRSIAKYSVHISVIHVCWSVFDLNVYVIQINLHEVLPWLCVWWMKTAFRVFSIQSSVFHFCVIYFVV